MARVSSFPYFRRVPADDKLPTMTKEFPHPVVHIEYPDWVDEVIDWKRVYETDEDRMRLAIAVARENVERGTGGPFGAAVFNATGHLVSVRSEERRVGKECGSAG